MDFKNLNRFRLTVLALPFILVLLLGACSNETNSPSESTDQHNSPDVSDQTVENTSGGELKLALSGGGQALAPASELRTVNDLIISGTTLEKLGKYDGEGKMQPLLAKDWEENPEDLTITFELNQGIQFHDGTDFNAEAVKWNIDEFLASGRAELNGIQDVEILGDYTVQVQLDEWNSSMLNNICHFVSITSPSAYEENGKDWVKDNPVGTGPFKFVSWTKDESVVFEKNTNYWQEGKPYLDGVTFNFMADATTATSSLQVGEIHGFVGAPALSAKEMSEVEELKVETLTTGLGSLGKGIIGDSANPQSPFADPLVRGALSYAVDRDAIVEILYYGHAIATNQWGVPGSPTFNDDLDTTYDPEKAKELLKEAGYPNGFKTTFTTNNNDADVSLATAIQGYLSEVGIDVELNTVDNAFFRELTTSANNQPWDGLVLYNHRGDFDLGTYMPRNFSSQATTYGHHLTEVEEIVTLFNEVKGAKDSNELADISKDIQRLVAVDHALATFILVEGLPFISHESVLDTGINFGHGSEWTPENAKISSK
ncbi:ABC transporter substrate-binding protein [Halalkalibacter krulwichiae]|uniref:Glutathione-binding protein GsiB n=1 Tax=Halalkalibacter krulwichiae TaxID=199441 RepID=A0A1X9M920_9BACI|nr:ABC transporter substrate-binding protein [Halalkalibacter krulwichiae]ARK29915.1 Glutathione-binding protein GsiB precursor [Halalkalibacter krulwichiae]